MISDAILDFLDYHGYQINIQADKVIIKKHYDYISPLVLFFILLFLSVLLIPISFVLIIIFFLGLFLHRRHSNAYSLVVYRDIERVSYSDFSNKRRFILKHIKGIYMQSKYNGAYTSAFKRTSEEYQIILGIELIRGERYELFRFSSDHQEPNREIKEVEEYLKHLLVTSAHT